MSGFAAGTILKNCGSQMEMLSNVESPNPSVPTEAEEPCAKLTWTWSASVSKSDMQK